MLVEVEAVIFTQRNEGWTHTHIILPQVNTLSAHGQGNIHAVVYDQGDTIALGHLFDFSRSRNQNTGVTLLVTILDNRDT